MSLLLKLRKIAEDLDREDGLTISKESSITIITPDDQRIEIPAPLAHRIFGSPENIRETASVLTGDESLELQNVQVATRVWVALEEAFSLVEEV
jgi:hypothetical protein